MKYELCYLVGESKEQDLPKIKEEVSGIVSKEGGQWQELQVEEKRKMAYKVGKDTRGIYVAQQFDIAADEADEETEPKNVLESISKKLNLYQNILRFIIVKADDLPALAVREVRQEARKDFRKPMFGGKRESTNRTPVGKPQVKKEIPQEAPAEKKEASPAEPEVKEKEPKEKESEKSIDEKIDEILNI